MLLKIINKKSKVILIIVGLLSLIWFLIRVIPKPSRATYPCQRAVSPFASTFVIWIIGVLRGKYFFKKAKHSFAKANYWLVIVFIVASVFSFAIITLPLSTISASLIKVLI
jgi:uncharacterized membrane protein YbhN (UPF0104 family)